MICFEVYINGNKVCTAGVGDSGILTAMLTWFRTRDEALPEEELSLRVSGSGPGDLRMNWLDGQKDLQSGDEVTIKIIESDTADEATQIVHPPVGEPDWWRKYKQA